METRLLTEIDRRATQALCEESPEYNSFFLANLGNLSSQPSCQQALVQYWGQFDDVNRLVGVLMCYHVLWYVYDTPGADLRGFAEVLERMAQPSIVVNDNVRTAPSLAVLLRNYQPELDIRAHLRRLCSECFVKPALTDRARRAGPDDVEPLARFYAQAPKDVRRGPDSIRRSIGGGRRTFLVEVNGEVVAAALTTAELPTLAMIGGLHASPGARAQDHLTCALSELVLSLFEEGKQACVVTRDPMIEAICDWLGFEDMGPWRIVHLRRREV